MTTYIGAGPELRIVLRKVYEPVPGKDYSAMRTERVLQYGLRPVNGHDLHWLDVPTIEEPK